MNKSEFESYSKVVRENLLLFQQIQKLEDEIDNLKKQKTNIWHNLQQDPTDIPVHFTPVIVAYTEEGGHYYNYDIVESWERERFTSHTENIIAWKEI